MAAVAGTRPPATRRVRVFGLLAAAIVAVNVLLVSRYPQWQGQAAPEWPIAVDLLLNVPLLYLGLNFRHGSGLIWRVAAIAGIGVLLGSFIIPQESKQLWLVLELLRYVMIGAVLLVQLGVVASVVAQIVATRHAQNAEVALDGAIAARLSGRAFANLIRLEARVWLFALLRRPIRHPYPGQRHFFVGAQGMNASNQLGFLILVGAEIPVVHFLVSLFDPLVAVIVSALSIYGLLFMLAEYRATVHRPISVGSDGLQVRYGLATDFHLPWKSIAQAEGFKGPVRRARGELRLIGMGEANVVLHLSPGTRLAGLFGERDTQRIYLGIDDPTALLAEVQSRIG
jgi:hypothetical protein